MSKKAELHIRGLKDPIMIDADIAATISGTLKNNTVDDNTPIVLEGIWSGKKKDIKYVLFPKQGNEDAWSKKIEPMSSTESVLFEKKIYPNKIEANGYGFGEYNWPLFYMQRMGAIEIHVHKDRFKREHLVPYVLDISLYPKLQDEIDSYMLYLSRKEYAIKMSAQEYEAVAKTLAVKM